MIKRKDDLLLAEAYQAVQEDFNSKRIANQILIKLQNRGFQNALGPIDSGGFSSEDGNSVEFYSHKDGEHFLVLAFTPSMKFIKGAYVEDPSGHVAKYIKTLNSLGGGNVSDIIHDMRQLVGKEDYGHVEDIDNLERLMEVLS